MAPGLTDIDWSVPWLAPWRALGEPVAREVLAGWPQHEALNRAVRAPLRFVPQSALPAGVAYERHIFEQGQVPTREGLHDFYNGLCWMLFPQAKRRLNQLQAAEIVAAGVGAVRGPVRDAITVFDENAALLQAPEALWQALAARDWGRLFGELRPLWGQARLLLFGHALLEKLVAPYKSVTAHVWRVEAAVDAMAELDTWLAADLTPAKLAAKPFAPLPVLGVPGWWPANEAPGFYEDDQVFRPARGRRTVAQ
ncbi:DUF3025 domain-containing protein [Ramlibacter sp. 2FC]|uniref:DUF3025 domain-containing protein n=1 Tax=Ramlibacter sp. 2FC TaxID=2502188 RepID=UPI00201DB365|nr:DUF3025 domain-containing protein [Ramlibacter sp. 2FC]